MSSLENVYCLGCKTRHETVEIQAVKKMTVRNSIRHQAYGICPEGKKWTKILKKDDIPEGVPIEDHTKSSEEKVEVVESAPEGEVEVISPMPVFQMALDSVAKEEPVIEEPVIEEPVIEEPVIEEPVIEEPVVEETVGLEDEEEDGGEYVQLNHVRPRTPRKVTKREPIRPTPPPRIREQPNEDLMERAYSMGERMGFLIAQESGVEFMDRFDEALSHTQIPPQYRSYFYEGFLEGGTEFVDNLMRDMQHQESAVEEEKSDMKPTTVAGIAGLGIFGAWLASRIKGGNN